jgi:hypothetical protein
LLILLQLPSCLTMRKLAGLQFKFAYKKGCENKVVDALSRIGFHF